MTDRAEANAGSVERVGLYLRISSEAQALLGEMAEKASVPVDYLTSTLKVRVEEDLARRLSADQLKGLVSLTDVTRAPKRQTGQLIGRLWLTLSADEQTRIRDAVGDFLRSVPLPVILNAISQTLLEEQMVALKEQVEQRA